MKAWKRHSTSRLAGWNHFPLPPFHFPLARPACRRVRDGGDAAAGDAPGLRHFDRPQGGMRLSRPPQRFERRPQGNRQWCQTLQLVLDLRDQRDWRDWRLVQQEPHLLPAPLHFPLRQLRCQAPQLVLDLRDRLDLRDLRSVQEPHLLPASLHFPLRQQRCRARRFPVPRSLVPVPCSTAAAAGAKVGPKVSRRGWCT